MTRSERRRIQRARQAKLIAAGTYTPRAPSAFTRPEIAEAIRQDIHERPRHRARVVDPRWHWKPDPVEVTT